MKDEAAGQKTQITLSAMYGAPEGKAWVGVGAGNCLPRGELNAWSFKAQAIAWVLRRVRFTRQFAFNLKCWALNLKYWALAFKVWALNFKLWVWNFKFWALNFKGWALNFKFWALNFKFWATFFWGGKTNDVLSWKTWHVLPCHTFFYR